MLKHLLIPAILVAPFALTVGCGGSSSNNPSNSSALDGNGDKLADDLGSLVDANHDGVADTIDINKDGIPDGPEVDTSGKGAGPYGLALDENCDGIYDSVDLNGDGLPDLQTAREKITTPAGCHPDTVSGSGHVGGAGAGNGAGGAPSTSAGAPSTSAGAPATGAGGGAVAHAGSPGTSGGAGAPTTGAAGGSTTGSELGTGQFQGSGSTTDRNAQFDVYRNNIGYKFIANGWGTNWQSHNISWNGTSFTVKSLNGTQGSDYSPAGYPSMFCGLYSSPTGIQSDPTSPCGLPAAISSLKSVKTGWRWKSNGQGGQYNAAWDIWLGDSSNKLSSYLMVWLRDPPGQQPAGSPGLSGVTVAGLPGTWNIWQGSVNGHPIINYVQPEGKDLSELEFNVMDVYKDATKRYSSLTGTQLLAVAIGYEVWNGPISNVETDDFYVEVSK